MIARRLKTYLEGIAAVADRLAEARFGIRIRVGSIPQGMPLPYVRLAEIGGRPDYHLGGELGDLPTSVQCDVWADSEELADQLAEAIRLAPLSGFRGAWSAADGSTVEVKAVTIESEIGTYEDPLDGSDDMRFRNTRVYKIHHERPILSLT